MVDEKNPVWIPPHELVQMWQFCAEILDSPKYQLVGQNFKFDDQKLRSPCDFRPANIYADTMLMAHTLYPEFPLGLAFLASIWTEEPYYKTEGESSILRRIVMIDFIFTTPKTRLSLWKFLRKRMRNLDVYGLRDFYYNFVNKLHVAYRDMESVGMLVNQSTRRDLKKKYNQQLAEYQERLDHAVGQHINVNSPKQINALLYHDMGLPIRKDTSEDTLVALQGNHCKEELHKQILSDILIVRRIRKTLSTYLDASPDYDGRMRTSFRIVGTETGRSFNRFVESSVATSQSRLGFPDNDQTWRYWCRSSVSVRC